MYSVDIRHQEDMVFEVKSRDYGFLIDAKGKGMTPPDTLLAALGSCIGVYIRKYAEGAKLDLEKFKITVEAEFPKEPPLCFREIRVLLDFEGVQMEERRRKALLEFIKNCPVHNTLKANPLVEIRVV